MPTVSGVCCAVAIIKSSANEQNVLIFNRFPIMEVVPHGCILFTRHTRQVGTIVSARCQNHPFRRHLIKPIIGVSDHQLKRTF